MSLHFAAKRLVLQSLPHTWRCYTPYTAYTVEKNRAVIVIATVAVIAAVIATNFLAKWKKQILRINMKPIGKPACTAVV